MNEIFDFLKGLDMVRIGLLIAALVVAWPIVKGFLPKILSMFSGRGGMKRKDRRITSMVSQWEDLYNSAHEAGLHDACAKLEDMFPLLVKNYEHKPK